MFFKKKQPQRQEWRSWEVNAERFDKMHSLTRLRLIEQSFENYRKTGDMEHLKDIERIIEYENS